MCKTHTATKADNVVAWASILVFFYVATIAPMVGHELSDEATLMGLAPLLLAFVYFKLKHSLCWLVGEKNDD